MAAAGKPVIVVLMNGGAVAVEAANGSSALMYLGLAESRGGGAVVSVVDLMKNAEVGRARLPRGVTLVELVACA